ncbi:MAG: hypothetical protein K0B14_02920 [Anaerolineaceae bacterium]|nr:hypothetical protein [Anaerolineaceae bacterium]
MEKINHLHGHSEYFKDLVTFIPLQSLGEFTLYLSSFHDKIISGELVELPGELQENKMQTSEVIQELQILHQKAFGKNHFSQPIKLN